MPQFSAAVCYSFTSSSIQRHVGWYRHSNACSRFYTHTLIQALSHFLWVCGEVVLPLLFIIFGLISFCICLFSVKHKNLLFKTTLWIHLSWLSEDPISTLTLPTRWSVLSLSKSPLPIFSLSQSHWLSISRAPSLSVLSALMALSVCAERSIS